MLTSYGELSIFRVKRAETLSKLSRNSYRKSFCINFSFALKYRGAENASCVERGQTLTSTTLRKVSTRAENGLCGSVSRAAKPSSAGNCVSIGMFRRLRGVFCVANFWSINEKLVDLEAFQLLAVSWCWGSHNKFSSIAFQNTAKPCRAIDSCGQWNTKLGKFSGRAPWLLLTRQRVFREIFSRERKIWSFNRSRKQ